MLIDTHCHIHDQDYPLSAGVAVKNALDAEVTKLICVGTNESSSKLAVEFSKRYPKNVFAAIGVHPHDAKHGWSELIELLKHKEEKVVAIGEIGLDYHYNFSPKETQIEVLKRQIELAIQYDLPIIFHVREAFDDFWKVYDSFINSGYKIRGVVHSFTDNQENAQKALERGLYIGINGFSTFTKDESQKELFKNLPLNRILFETDAPYLTPVPFRGKINEPAFVRNVAEYHADLRGISLNEISAVTSKNAADLFGI